MNRVRLFGIVLVIIGIVLIVGVIILTKSIPKKLPILTITIACNTDSDCPSGDICVKNPDIGIEAPPRICLPIPQTYSCDSSNNTCTVDPNGKYSDLYSCQTACSTYNCNIDNNTCSPGGDSGYFQSLNDCNYNCSFTCENPDAVSLQNQFPNCNAGAVDLCDENTLFTTVCGVQYPLNIGGVHDIVYYNVCRNKDNGSICTFISTEQIPAHTMGVI